MVRQLLRLWAVPGKACMFSFHTHTPAWIISCSYSASHHQRPTKWFGLGSPLSGHKHMIQPPHKVHSSSLPWILRHSCGTQQGLSLVPAAGEILPSTALRHGVKHALELHWWVFLCCSHNFHSFSKIVDTVLSPCFHSGTKLTECHSLLRWEVQDGSQGTSGMGTSLATPPLPGVLQPCALDPLIGPCAGWTALSLLLLLLRNQTLLTFRMCWRCTIYTETMYAETHFLHCDCREYGKLCFDSLVGQKTQDYLV